MSSVLVIGVTVGSRSEVLPTIAIHFGIESRGMDEWKYLTHLHLETNESTDSTDDGFLIYFVNFNTESFLTHNKCRKLLFFAYYRGTKLCVSVSVVVAFFLFNPLKCRMLSILKMEI